MGSVTISLWFFGHADILADLVGQVSHYKSAVYGDAVVLPLWLFCLVSLGRSTQVRGIAARLVIRTTTVVAVLIGASTQVYWILDPETALNWTIPARHHFNGAGFYHAAFLVVATATLTYWLLRFLYALAHTKHTHLSTTLRDPTTMGAFFLGPAFIVLLALDETAESSTKVLLVIAWALPSILYASAWAGWRSRHRKLPESIREWGFAFCLVVLLGSGFLFLATRIYYVGIPIQALLVFLPLLLTMGQDFFPLPRKGALHVVLLAALTSTFLSQQIYLPETWDTWIDQNLTSVPSRDKISGEIFGLLVAAALMYISIKGTKSWFKTPVRDEERSISGLIALTVVAIGLWSIISGAATAIAVPELVVLSIGYCAVLLIHTTLRLLTARMVHFENTGEAIAASIERFRVYLWGGLTLFAYLAGLLFAISPSVTIALAWTEDDFRVLWIPLIFLTGVGFLYLVLRNQRNRAFQVIILTVLTVMASFWAVSRIVDIQMVQSADWLTLSFIFLPSAGAAFFCAWGLYANALYLRGTRSSYGDWPVLILLWAFSFVVFSAVSLLAAQETIGSLISLVMAAVAIVALILCGNGLGRAVAVDDCRHHDHSFGFTWQDCFMGGLIWLSASCFPL